MLELRRLRLLSELSQRGTIAEVARVAGYTPSAVSQALAQLEREAGVALLERDGRRVRLTEPAHRLVARTERAIAELDAAEADLAAEQGAVRGEVVVGAFPTAAARLLLPAVRALADRHPELTCVVREHEPDDGIALLRSGDLDLLISESYGDAEPAAVGGLDRHLLLTEPLLLVMRAPAPEPVELASLRDAGWIGGLKGTPFAAALDQACRAAGFDPRIVHRADDADLHRSLAAAGVGIGMLPELACAPAEAVHYARATPAPPPRRVWALLRRGAARRPALAAVLDALA
jgi:DNA-binding transcriptional LysR family regulator